MALFSGVLLVLVGALALGLALAPESGALLAAREGLLRGVGALVGIEALGLSPDLPTRLEAMLGAVWMRFVPAPIGLVVLVAALLPGRTSRFDDDDDEISEEPTRAEARVMKKAKKEAASIARSRSPLEAAEYALERGLLEEAATYFIAGEAFERAAEMRHSQDRFIESAELYAKAGRHDAAGSIFSQYCSSEISNFPQPAVF